MKLAVCGISGRVGRAILSALIEKGHTLGAAFDSEKSGLISHNAMELLNNNRADCIITAIKSGIPAQVDGIIDFSGPAATMELLDSLAGFNKPLVIGTTGLTDAQIARVKDASGKFPVLISPNMSLGVNLLFKLTEIASKALSTDYDVEIFEAHHRFKKDAPSGTAKRLLEAVMTNMKGLEGADVINGRDGITGERRSNEIGMHAMRGGNIIGEHTVYFTAMDERVELTHRAASRDVFARGAVAAAEYLAGKSPGYYSMFDVLGF